MIFAVASVIHIHIMGQFKLFMWSVIHKELFTNIIGQNVNCFSYGIRNLGQNVFELCQIVIEHFGNETIAWIRRDADQCVGMSVELLFQRYDNGL